MFQIELGVFRDDIRFALPLVGRGCDGASHVSLDSTQWSLVIGLISREPWSRCRNAADGIARTVAYLGV